MSDREIAIRCHNVGKCFRPEDADPYLGLRARLNTMLNPWSRGRAGSNRGTVWALRDLSFEAPAGRVIGVLGANGSGKSVLLRILARVTKPGTGRAEVYGSVGAMLQVGGLLLPELTGRETIYQIGAILRLRRAAIDQRFDEIVDFAGIAPQLDALVRGYSAGMQVRLAFAVFAYLEADVLLVDEALSVADQEFRRRCADRIRHMATQGRTIVLVSHEMEMMADLCDWALVLQQGELKRCGAAGAVIDEYRRSMHAVSSALPEGR